MSEEQHGFPWILLLVGLVIGLVGGVYYAWYLNPVSLTNVSPQQLTAEDQQAYVVLISEAYLHDADLERARARLGATGARDVTALVVSLSNSAYLGGEERAAYPLTILGEALGGDPLGVGVFTGTLVPTSVAMIPSATFEGIPSPTPSPFVPTATPIVIRPTVTPTQVVIPPDTRLMLVALETLCEDDHPPGLIEIYVNGMDGNGIPAIEITVEWEEQVATFFTGLKPDVDPGYADFEMEPNQTYTVTLVGWAEPVFGLDSYACETPSGTAQAPTYQLIFAPTMDQP
ncbi:MAG: hypothetical protein JXB30_03215 [Anaerolineae bacterium]|nr:hypothetical protein [Anaerolineae bacterium]